jgi:hypothetical protein
MKAEFLKDDNGNIWFFYAESMQVRNCKGRMGIAYELKSAAANKANVEK